ncbi:hypothetical protein HZH66_012509 [Vespula vulgaris]|uniref:Uncharacterized protein n=1 Tax=Vespula vulgaris TaxID=7454 RepID=A0A834MUK5_VESVU|nr:hypothetical protein HZH66_012509 [Vespula vulgaris]
MVGTRGASKRTSDVQQRVKLGKAVAAVSPDRPRVAAHRHIAAGTTTTTRTCSGLTSAEIIAQGREPNSASTVSRNWTSRDPLLWPIGYSLSQSVSCYKPMNCFDSFPDTRTEKGISKGGPVARRSS